MNSGNYIYHLTATIVVSIWGMTFVSTKYLLNSGMQPEWIFFIRFFIAYIGLLAISHKKILCNSVRDEFLCFIMGLFGGSLYFIIENIALNHSTASNIALIVCTAPIFTLLLSSFINKEKLSLKVISGLFISMIGVAFLLFKDVNTLHFNPYGDFLALLASICWSVYTLTLGTLIKRYHSTFITRKTFFYGIVTSIPMIVMNKEGINLSHLLETDIIVNLVFLSIIASLICYFVWGKTIGKLGSVSTCNYLYINPVAAVITSIIVLDEKVSLFLFFGMILVFSGLYISQKRHIKSL